MSKAPNNTSPKERENLRRRLQVLFKNQETAGFINGQVNKKMPNPNVKVNYNRINDKTEVHEAGISFPQNKSLENKVTKLLKNQKKPPAKDKTKTNICGKDNGTNSNQDFKKKSKSKGISSDIKFAVEKNQQLKSTKANMNINGPAKVTSTQHDESAELQNIKAGSSQQSQIGENGKKSKHPKMKTKKGKTLLLKSNHNLKTETDKLKSETTPSATISATTLQNKIENNYCKKSKRQNSKHFKISEEKNNKLKSTEKNMNINGVTKNSKKGISETKSSKNTKTFTQHAESPKQVKTKACSSQHSKTIGDVKDSKHPHVNNKDTNSNFEKNSKLKQHIKQESESKSATSSVQEKINSTTNAQTKQNKNDSKYSKKPKKRFASITKTTESKKAKLNEESIKEKHILRKTSKQHKGGAPLASAAYHTEMTGRVGGGDYGSDSEYDELEHNNWMLEKEDDSNNSNYDSDDESDIVYYDTSEEEDEEEEHYSDFDENDYEEDEDSYDYSADSDEYSFSYDEYDSDECSSSADDYDYDLSYDNEDDENDTDYKLPQQIPEDLIIHRGTAEKRDLKPDDNVCFNSENEEAQVIELEEQHIVKVVEQPKILKSNELPKLKYEQSSTPTNVQKTEKTSNATTSPNDIESCPQLVPIVDEEGFQLYNPNAECTEELVEEQESIGSDECDDDDESLGSEYSKINSDDEESFLSEDINDKYVHRGYDNDSEYSIDEDEWCSKQNVDIIDATGYEFESKYGEKCDNDVDVSINDDIGQIPSMKLYENVDLKTESSIISTTILDNKIFESSPTIETEDDSFKESNEPEDRAHTQIKENLDDSVVAMERENKTARSSNVKKSSNQNLADYRTKFFNAIDANLVIVLVKVPFYIYGTVRLTLLIGTVEVYGHSLSLNTEIELFSPRGCSVIEIAASCSKRENSTQSLKDILKEYEQHFALPDLKKICKLFDPENDAIILLKRNESRKKVVQQFKKYMNENVFPNLKNIGTDRPLYNSEYLLRCMINTTTQEQKCLRLPEQWQQLCITPKSRVMITGGKSVGKSTLLRYLINRHLPQKILLIDLDIGQPEVFVPQTVSCTIVKQPLIGPGFMQNLQPEMSYVVGHTNIILCAHKYMKAVRSLISYCLAQEEYNELPWLINTMGYNKGFGLELISTIAKELPLTDLVQLASLKDINNFDSPLFPHVVNNVPHNMFVEETCDIESGKENTNYRLHMWKSAVQQESRYQKEWEMSPKDFRFAMLLARLSEALQGHAEWLTDCKPMSASLDDLKIVNLVDNTPLKKVEDLAKAIEANLVYLCNYKEDNQPLKCLGIGIVRAVDFHIRQLYLLPALPYSQLKDVNCVAIGEMPLATSLFTNQGPRVKNIAPFVYNTVAAKASKAIKQIYRRPRHFLTGKHKPLD